MDKQAQKFLWETLARLLTLLGFELEGPDYNYETYTYIHKGLNIRVTLTDTEGGGEYL
jgi:hypothetical protein